MPASFFSDCVAVLIAFLCLSGVSPAVGSDSSLPSGLMTSGRSGVALHVEAADVKLTWVIPHLSTCDSSTPAAHPLHVGQSQSSFRVVVGTSAGAVRAGKGSVFDSDVVSSSSSVSVSLPGLGPRLQPFTRYFWAVQVQTTTTTTTTTTASLTPCTATSGWSNPAEFVTASLNTNFPPTAKPIWAAGDASYVMARGEMTLPPSVPPSSISRAVAYVTGQSGASKAPDQLLGAYKLWVNGVLSGVGPGRTDFGQFTHPTFDTVAQPVDAIDVTSAVSSSPPPSSSSSSSPSSTVTFGLQGYGGAMWLFVCLFTDASPVPVATFSSNSSTFTALDLATNSVLTTGPNLAGGYGQHQENWDGTHFPVGWLAANFSSVWPAAVDASPFKHPLLAKPARPLFIGPADHAPTQVAVNPSFVFVDFTREFMGGIQLVVATGADPVHVNIRLGEELTSATSILYPMRTGNRYESNWTFPANSNVTLAHHEYMEFRYGELRFSCPTCAASTPPYHLSAWQVRYPFVDQFSFASSNSTLDAVVELCHYTLTHAEVDTWTDSNTRERLPYGADGFIAGSGVFGLSRETAWVEHSFEYNLRHITWPTEWHQIFSLLAEQLLLVTGSSTPMLATSFDTLVANSMLYAVDPVSQLVNFTHARRLPGTRDVIDWPESTRDGFVMSNVASVVNAYAVAAFRSLATVADALGRTANATALRAQANATASAMTRLMRQSSGSRLFCDTVCAESDHTAFQSSAFALWLDVVTDADSRKSLAEWLFSRGMVGSVYAAWPYVHGLFKDVSDFGARAVAALTSGAQSSWVHMLQQGATMTMEAWYPSQKPNLTWSHPWATAPLSAVLRYVLGLTATTPTHATFRVQPQLGPLEHVQGVVPTLRGMVGVHATQSGDVSSGTYTMTVSVDVPAGTTATVCVRQVATPGAVGHVTLDGVAVATVEDGGGLCVAGGVGSAATPRVVQLTSSVVGSNVLT